MVHDDYFFDKDCPSYAQGSGTTEFWRDMSDKYKKQNDLFRDKIDKLEKANKVLMEAVKSDIEWNENSPESVPAITKALTEAKRIMEGE